MFTVPGTELASVCNRVTLALAALATAAGLTLLGVAACKSDSVPSAASLDHPVPIPTATSPMQSQPTAQRSGSRPTALSDPRASTPTTLAQPTAQQGGSRPAALSDHRPHDRGADSRDATITLPGHERAAPIVGERIVNGILGVPADVHTIGWDVHSASLDSIHGSTVLVGHIDYVGQGDGYFHELAFMREGAIITTRSSTGDRRTWRTTTVVMHPKDRKFPAALFDSAGPRRLILISCGGQFDRATGSYLDNVIVTATPTS